MIGGVIARQIWPVIIVASVAGSFYLLWQRLEIQELKNQALVQKLDLMLEAQEDIRLVNQALTTNQREKRLLEIDNDAKLAKIEELHGACLDMPFEFNRVLDFQPGTDNKNTSTDDTGLLIRPDVSATSGRENLPRFINPDSASGNSATTMQR